MELPRELCEWLDELPLSRNYGKSFLRVFSDGVLVAEIIAHQFPKLIQLHSYSEQNTVDGKRSNWELLNRKALTKLRCPLSNEQIDVLIQWSSSEQLIDFLSILKLKLAAYEPIYLARLAVITAKSQEEKDAQRIKRHEARKVSLEDSDETVASKVVPDGSEQLSDVSTASRASSHSNTTTRHAPRKKAANTPKRLKPTAGPTVASMDLPSAETIDQMYLQLTDSLVTDLAQLTERLDSLEARSIEFDTQIKQQRQKNLDDMKKTEMRVAQLQLEQREIEQGGLGGVMLAVNHLLGGDGDRVNEPLAGPDGDVFCASATIDTHTVHQLASELDKAEVKHEQNDCNSDTDTSSDSDDSLPPPPPPRLFAARIAHQNQEASDNHTETQHSATPSSDIRSDGQPLKHSPTKPEHKLTDTTSVVQWLQFLDADSQKDYFASTRTGITQWEMPTAGIIKCRQQGTQQVYFVDAATQQSAWNVEDLVSHLQQEPSDL